MVLDAGALTLHFSDHPGVRQYFDAITSGRSLGMVAAPNLAEFYYKACQKFGRATADTWYFWLANSEIEIVEGGELARQAGLEKCRGFPVLSLADCYALALAKSKKADLVTTDQELARAAGTSGKHVKLD